MPETLDRGTLTRSRLQETELTIEEQLSESALVEGVDHRAPRRRKIVVFSTKGGGAHAAAVRALEAYLDGRHELRVVNFFETFVRPLDPFWKISFGRFSGEDFYNLCLRRGWHGAANHLATTYAWPRFLRLAPKIEAQVVPFLDEEQPDLVISVIPLVNAILTATLRPRGIPLLVLPVDLDVTNYILGLGDQPYDRLRFVLPFDDLEIRRRIAPARIPRHQVKVLGFPVRPGFLEPKDPAPLRAELGFPAEKPVVMLLMGGAGASGIRGFVKELARSEAPLHLVACVGRNAALGKKLAATKLGRGVSLSVIGYTERIAELMAASDLLITKPGPATISEAIYTNLPMLLDGTSRPLHWEVLNLELIRQHGLGEVLARRRDVRGYVSRFFEDDAYRAQIQASLRTFPRNGFSASLRSLLREMLEMEPFPSSEPPAAAG